MKFKFEPIQRIRRAIRLLEDNIVELDECHPHRVHLKKNLHIRCNGGFKNLSHVAEVSHEQNTDWKLRRGSDDGVLIDSGKLCADLDFAGHRARNMRIDSGDMFPDNPVHGQLFLKSGKLYVYIEE